MDLALRPRINAPDVVRSALGPREKISENTIDKLFGAPNKICIPERYIPEQPPELSPEEKKRRQEKVEMIKKMLSETTPSVSLIVPVISELLIQINLILGHSNASWPNNRREEAARAFIATEPYLGRASDADEQNRCW